jgi:uncharacterized lipoprotein YajG
LLLTVAVALLGACGTNNLALQYKSTVTNVAPVSNVSPVSVGLFVDQRGETATWFGAIRGGFGNPLKILEATPSVAAVVQTAFADGLRARGFQVAGDGKGYQIAGVIKKLDCSQYVRREAHVEIEVAVFESVSGKKLFTRTYTADSLEGSLLALNTGVFASVEALRALAEKTLAEVVDKALDDSALRDAMRP